MLFALKGVYRVGLKQEKQPWCPKYRNTSEIHTDLHTAQVSVPSVNISERPSVHRAGRRHLQLVANLKKSGEKMKLIFLWIFERVNIKQL